MLSDDVEDLVELFLREILRPHVRVQGRFLDDIFDIIDGSVQESLRRELVVPVNSLMINY